MSNEILLIQGGGEGAYTEDLALAEYVKSALPEPYTLSYPQFTGLETIDYSLWQTEATNVLEQSGKDLIIVAHSLGGAALLKLLVEAPSLASLKAVYLVAAPYKCTDGEWGKDEFAIPVDVGSRLPDIGRLVLYHSRDDEWVPFEHLALYAQKIPQASIVELDGRGHGFTKSDFQELIDDIRQIS